MRSILAGLRRLVVPWGASGSTPRVVIDSDDPIIQAGSLDTGILLYWDNDRAFLISVENSGGTVGQFRIDGISEVPGESSWGQAIQLDHDPTGVIGGNEIEIGRNSSIVRLLGDEIRFGDFNPQNTQVGDQSSYTPQLTADTTNPNLGSGATRFGLYRELGDVVDLWITIIFGTGSTAGAGRYVISLPTAVSNDLRVSGGGGQGSIVGHGYVRDNGTLNNSQPVQAHLLSRTGGPSGVGEIQMFHGVGYDVSAGSPFTFTDNDAISLQLRYLSA